MQIKRIQKGFIGHKKGEKGKARFAIMRNC